MIRAARLAALLLVLLAGPAEAGPLFLAVLSAGGSFGAAFAATALGGFLSTTIGRLLISVAVSALQRALVETPRDPGLQTRVTLSGGTNPLSFVLGRYATAGVAACPPMSHDDSNKYLTYVISLSALPITGLSRVSVDGEYVAIGPTPDADGFRPFLGRLAGGLARIKVYDGTQTVADPWLLATYGSYPERPWSSDMVGTGIAYAILDFHFNREVFQGLPEVRFEIDGAKLYDPRADSSVGGSGAQRWADRTTWTFTQNPAVMLYNIRRGVTLADGSVWGGLSPVTLPLSSWFAAMNECDAGVPLTGGGTEPQFRAGFEASVDDEPASVFEELLRAAQGAVAEQGDTCRIRVGPPGLPVQVITDDDVVVTRPQDFDPFPGLDATYNGIQASHPSPDALWEATDAPPLFDAGLEALDGGRRLVAELSLPAAPFAGQVQRIMRAALLDHRRMRRHTISLPPEALVLEPLDTLSWTSARNGYAAKLFDVGSQTDETLSVIQTVALREVDPADYDWLPGYAVAVTTPSVAVVAPGATAVPGWTVTGGAVGDGTTDRRPALMLAWTGAALASARGLSWEVRLAGGATVLRGDVLDVAAGGVTLVEGILSGQAYEVRARPLMATPTTWTAWTAATAGTVLLGPADVAEGVLSLRHAGRLADRLVDSFEASNGGAFLGFVVAPYAYAYPGGSPEAVNPVALTVTGAVRTLGDYATVAVLRLSRAPAGGGAWTYLRDWDIGAGPGLSHVHLVSVGDDVFLAGSGYQYRLTAWLPPGALPVKLYDLTLHLRQESG
ncbi:MAG: phage tail protein [Gemmobacter sp.]